MEERIGRKKVWRFDWSGEAFGLVHFAATGTTESCEAEEILRTGEKIV